MKTLYIVRHAKSSWEYESIKDIDRPLKKRGINDAHLMSNLLVKKINRPDLLLSSSANRALHTNFLTNILTIIGGKIYNPKSMHENLIYVSMKEKHDA